MVETEMAQEGRTRSRRGGKRLKLFVGGVIIVLVVAYLIFAAAQGSAAYYLTVEELLSRDTSTRNVRVAGVIVEGSIVWKERDLQLEFEISDASGKLPAVYHGPRPDMFRDGAEVVIEGRYTPGGSFEAKTLMLKCPSKYEEASAANG